MQNNEHVPFQILVWCIPITSIVFLCKLDLLCLQPYFKNSFVVGFRGLNIPLYNYILFIFLLLKSILVQSSQFC
jgi:hypothetical protein